MERFGSAGGQPRNRLPEALLNSEIASPTSSSVGWFAAATTTILEGAANAWFKDDVGLGEVVVDSAFSGKSASRGGASAVSLRAGNIKGFVRAFGVFAGPVAL